MKQFSLLPCTFFLVLFIAKMTSLQAQNVGIGTNTPLSLTHISGGNLLVTGTDQNSSIEISGAGTRMFFNPKKAALRSGYVQGTEWDDANLGVLSVGLGRNALAKTLGSVSIGEGNIAETEPFAIAIGRQNHSAGFAALAMGHFSEATGPYSASIGLRDTVAGYSATAVGGYNKVNVAFGFAANGYNTVNGEFASALGTGNNAPSFGEVTMGHYATVYSAANDKGINISDRLFTIGNGTGEGNRRDAMVVLKNGNIGIGTAAPAARLEVTTSFKVSGEYGDFRVHPFFVPGNSTALLATFDGKTNGPQLRFDSDQPGFIDVGLNGDGNFVVEGNDATRMTITPGGNVGIGTSTPTSNLDIRGNGLDAGGVLNLGNSDNSHQLVLFGGRQNDPNPYIGWQAGDPLRFASYTGGFTEWMRIASDGNVGIGNSNPSAKLDIAGSIKMVDGNQGLGKVMTSDENGLASWQPAPTKASYQAYNYSNPITVPSGVETPANFTDVKYNENMVFNNGEFVIPYTGLYHFDIAAGPNNSFTNTISEQIRVRLNGNAYDVQFGYWLSVDIKVNAGDVVSFNILQVSGSTQTMGNFSRISCHKIN